MKISFFLIFIGPPCGRSILSHEFVEYPNNLFVCPYYPNFFNFGSLALRNIPCILNRHQYSPSSPMGEGHQQLLSNREDHMFGTAPLLY